MRGLPTSLSESLGCPAPPVRTALLQRRLVTFTGRGCMGTRWKELDAPDKSARSCARKSSSKLRLLRLLPNCPFSVARIVPPLIELSIFQRRGGKISIRTFCHQDPDKELEGGVASDMAAMESAAPQAGIDDIVGGMRGMLSEGQAEDKDALTPAELMER